MKNLRSDWEDRFNRRKAREEAIDENANESFSWFCAAGRAARCWRACGPQPPGRGRGGRGAGPGGSDVTDAALATYVAPGDLDEYYLFYSGGHSGQVFVAGIPVDAPHRHDPGLHAVSRHGLRLRRRDAGDARRLHVWGDSHHPGFSETDGEYDGRWLFINDNANGRIARIDLATSRPSRS